ncbi:hypothetical protein QE152_g7311 [Popillia japonica]|uniref:Secreted protein n=1 Tax=Popillia japonica TaxID=7064 RepID=A0AAW1MBW1_POPJA
MAINFSASFAACLAAGLKVPRQLMYCISQDYTSSPLRYASNTSRKCNLKDTIYLKLNVTYLSTVSVNVMHA